MWSVTSLGMLYSQAETLPRLEGSAETARLAARFPPALKGTVRPLDEIRPSPAPQRLSPTLFEFDSLHPIVHFYLHHVPCQRCR